MKIPTNATPERAHRKEPHFIEDRLLTICEAAALTNLSVGTLYHFVSQKRIPVVHISKRCIRFRQSDLFDWIRTLTQKAR